MKRVLFVLFLFPVVLFSQTQKLFTQFPLKNYIASDTGWIFLQADPLNGKVYKTPLSVLINSVNLSSTLPNGNYDDVSVYSNGVSILINDQKVTNNKLALSPPGTVKGNLSGSTAPPTDNNQTALRNFLSYHSVASTGNYFDLINRPTIPATFNPIAGNLISLSGTYPNIIFNVNSDNTKQNIINLTTTGSTGAATLIGATLNIPQYNLGSGSSQTLDQTLNFGNVTDSSIIQEDIDDITREIKPSNFNTSYGTAGIAKGFIEGVKSFAGVNSPDSRPNVVYSFGYNVNINGARINSNEAAFRFGYETNYNINSDTARRGFEFHLPEITTKEGNQLRLWSMYVNKSGGYTELNSQIENTYFTKVSNGANWLTLNNSNVENVIHQYGNDSATVIYTAMTNPDTQAGRITTKYSPTGSDTYEYAIKADNPTGKLFTTNMSTRFDNSLLSTSFMNISNTSSTGTPSQPTLTLDHANSGSSKVQAWNYNASLIAEVDKDYSLMAYKPVLLYYGGLIYGDLTLNHSFGGNLRLVGFGSGTATKNLSIDASGYVIESDLIEPNTLDQTLEFGNVTDTGIVFQDTALVGNTSYPFIVVKPLTTEPLQSDLQFIRSKTIQGSEPDNEVFAFGFNVIPVNGEPSLFESWESFYAPGVNDRIVEKHEMYYPYVTAGGWNAGQQIRLSSYTINASGDNSITYYKTVDNFSIRNNLSDYFAVGSNKSTNATSLNFFATNNSNAFTIQNNGTNNITYFDAGIGTNAASLTFRNWGSVKFGYAIMQEIGYIEATGINPANGQYLNLGSHVNLVRGGATNTMRLNFAYQNDNSANYFYIDGDGGSGEWKFYAQGGGFFPTFYSNGSEAMRLSTNRNMLIGTISDDNSALLNVSSTTKGFLPPRMTKTQRDAISSPATGLVIYQTDNTPGLRCYNGTNWMRYTETAD